MASNSNQAVVSNSSDIGETTATTVVDAGVVGDLTVTDVVGKVARVVAEEIVANDIVLPLGAGENVGEATARGEGLGGSLGLVNGVDEGGANTSDVRAAGQIIADKDVVVGTLAVAVAVSDTRVTTGNNSSDAQETKLHELVALALYLDC